jgi:hypothetical protein
MIKVSLTRFETGDDGTYSNVCIPTLFECYGLELPYRNNLKGLSCIFPGTYLVKWEKSPTRKNSDGTPEWSYRLQKVQGRDGVLIHSGNWAGDVLKGYKSNVEGCILLGRAILDIELPGSNPKKLQRGVSGSRDTISSFVSILEQQDFELTISWREGVAPA